MSPKSRATPSRPPVRSKTALPAPRVAPKRIRVPWHQRRPVQVVIALIVLGLLVLVVTQGLSTWHHHQATMKAKKGVKAFDAAYQTELTPLSNFFTQVNNSPQQYVGGVMSQATYATQTAQWLATFEALRKQLSDANPPGPSRERAGCWCSRPTSSSTGSRSCSSPGRSATRSSVPH